MREPTGKALRGSGRRPVMGVWRCPRCGSIATLEPQFGEILAVYDLCATSTDTRAGRGPVRMEPVALEDVVGTRERELVNSRG